MKSHWDLGRRPGRERDESAFREVSTFNTPEAAARKAQARKLGDFIAALEIPDTVTMSIGHAGHVGLSGTDPGQLLGYIQDVQHVNEVLH